ncbi:hypothetical protein LY90DRAFT_503424 [Neocallimastix californiae]|uniref:EGF-like domain-containing protein n=1 Tax=Neocallimastix californiae TaxID=1754190 RepID=A0A1Y2EN80_9FUNG|nr:hypothetical protein LY90DRAFT_503424 [Neocallimastix californiae]|eukprot:ORY73031.1 hypothetical protein LY90DRAFT_503424 [Neocallimastix californiae]
MSSQIKHYLENIIIDYIKINSDSLISSFYNNYISIINVEISNIFCFGDNSSVLSLDTGIMDSIINIENLKIYSCVSNGPIIRFNGNFNNIFIKNSTLYDNTSYGSTIENISKKTNMTIDNLYVMNNININKNECGIIQLRNNCDFHLTNSIFDNNYKLKMEEHFNNKFSKNYAEKMGGAIYISYINDANNENSNIYLSNNEFKNNKVDYFGGAIYIDFNKNDNIVINNSLFYENKAGISGGAVYSPYYAIPINNSNLDINNKAISYGNFLSTLPLKIRLENNNLQSLYIQSNNYIPLNFTLYDNYGQFVNDTLRYYSDITIKVSVIYNDKSFNNQIINRNTLKKISLRNDYDSSYKISGNVGSFTNGFCHLQNFKIQTKDKMNLMLRFEVENYIDNIYFITNNISISINDCTNIQYTKKDKNNFIQCEEFNCFPKCDSVKSFCKKNYTNSYYENSPKYNICTCKEGYKGDDCDDHIYDDIRYDLK